MTVRVGIHGASGRMGLAVAELILAQKSKFSLTASLSGRETGEKALLDFCRECEVIIDFSVPEAVPALLSAAVKTNRKIVVGTTGLPDECMRELKKASQEIAVLYAPNMSIGANLVIQMARRMARVLGDYDAEIIDLHHKYKRDAPSGTALAIGRNIAAGRKQRFEDVAVFDRVNKGFRKDGEIGFSSIRAGSIWGEHEVMFAGASEVVTIGVRALSREVYAVGALFAASWLNSASAPGLYSMMDVIGDHLGGGEINL